MRPDPLSQIDTVENSPLFPLRKAVRNVVYRTGFDEASVSTAGTAYVVCFNRRLFVLTASHVRKQHPLEDLLIFPGREAKHPLRLANAWQIDPVEAENADESDVLVIEATANEVPPHIRREAQCINLTVPEHCAWHDHKNDALFFLIGFPLEGVSIDYDADSMETNQSLLHGRYLEQGVDRETHLLDIECPTHVSDFNGLSGSPVFCLRQDLPTSQPIFCGMVLRGGATTSRITFVGAEVIMHLLETASANRGDSAQA